MIIYDILLILQYQDKVSATVMDLIVYVVLYFVCIYACAAVFLCRYRIFGE